MRPAGEYNRRIRVESPTRTTAADGQQIAGWPALAAAPYALLWAAIETIGGDQQTQQGQQRAETRYRVFVRSSATTRGITARMRLRVRDRGGTWRTLHIGSAADISFSGDDVVIEALEHGPAGE